MNKRFTLFLLLLWALGSSCAHAEFVTSVHDGDSFHVAAFPQEVRIFGIDAPEIQPPPGTPFPAPPGDETQPFGKDSQAFLEKIVLNQEVDLQCHHGKSHKRPVCSVFLNGMDVGQQMVRHGFAFDEPRFTHQYDEDEAFAKTNQRGVWSLPNGGERPWDYRHRLRTMDR